MGRVPMDTADLSINRQVLGDVLLSRIEAALAAHRRGFCPVYNRTPQHYEEGRTAT